MEMKPTDKQNHVHDAHQNNITKKTDDASKLWSQYQKQESKKKLGTRILFYFVVVIVVILIIIGLYIIISTTDPLQSQ